MNTPVPLPRLRARTRYSCARGDAGNDAGNAVVEAAILAPLFIVFLAGLLAADRIRHAADIVTQAAGDAARTASIARTPGQAQREASGSALATLGQQGISCTPRVRLDLAGFARPPGQPATVTARVSCTLRLGDLGLGLPGSQTITRSHTSPLDIYRAR